MYGLAIRLTAAVVEGLRNSKEQCPSGTNRFEETFMHARASKVVTLL